MEKSFKKFGPNASPETLFGFAKWPKTAIAWEETLLKIRYFERESSKSLKKNNIIFSFQPSPF